MSEKWMMKGYLIGACSCDWGCPCSFDARPTQGFCEGGYVWHVSEGRYGHVALDGLTFCWYGKFPGPLHEGHGTAQQLIDAKATPEQREALLHLFTGKEGGPFTIFAAVTETTLEPLFAPFQVKIDGLRSSVKAGEYLDLTLSPIANPVTGEHENLRLQKPTGFTSTWADLGKSQSFRVHTPNLKYEHSGLYGEYSEFAYAGAAAADGAAAD